MKSFPVLFICNVAIPTLAMITSIAADSARIPYAWSTITNDQAVAVLYLNWPQSYGAIVDRLGYPNERTAQSDWYLRPGGRVRIDYDPASGEAIGYGWEGN